MIISRPVHTPACAQRPVGALRVERVRHWRVSGLNAAPSLRNLPREPPPQMIISFPVQMEECLTRPVGRAGQATHSPNEAPLAASGSTSGPTTLGGNGVANPVAGGGVLEEAG